MLTFLDYEIPPPRAWTATDLPDAAGLVTLDNDCLRELLELADVLAANPLPILSLRSDDFSLTSCKALMTTVVEQLDYGPGFAIIDRLPRSSWKRKQQQLCIGYLPL